MKKILIIAIVILGGFTLQAQGQITDKEQKREIRQDNFNDLKAKLELTDQQAVKVEKILKEQRRKFKQQLPSKEFLEHMTPEQKAAFKKEKKNLEQNQHFKTMEALKVVLTKEQLRRYHKYITEKKGKRSN